MAFAKGERQHTCGFTANPAPSPFPPAFVVARPFSRSFQKSQRSHVRVDSQIGDCLLRLYWFFCRGVGASPCSGLSWRLLFVVLSPWAGSRSRLVLALGLRRAVAPRKGNCWVRIDLAILGLLAQAIVIEIRNASLDFNCH